VWSIVYLVSQRLPRGERGSKVVGLNACDLQPRTYKIKEINNMALIRELVDSESTPKPTRTTDNNGYDQNSVSGAEGGGCEWTSRPAQPDTFTDPTAFQGKPVSTVEVGIDGNVIKRSGK
jgi:hypothetical protein